MKKFNVNFESKKGAFNISTWLAILVFVYSIFILIFYLKPTYTGMFAGVAKNATYVDDLNLDINDSGEYIWNLTNICEKENCRVKSISVSGLAYVNTSGNITIAIENLGKEYLIFNKSFELNQTNITENITIFEPEIYYLNDSCIETCDLIDIFNQSSYKLIFIISSNITVKLNSIKYTWEWVEATTTSTSIMENITTATTQKYEYLKTEQLRWKEKMEDGGIRVTITKPKELSTTSFSKERYTATLEKGNIEVEFEDFEDANWNKTVEVTGIININKINSFLSKAGLVLKDFVWVETNGFLEEGKYKARIVLPSIYKTVFECGGTKENPVCSQIQACGSRPCFEIENGKTAILLYHFSGGGGADPTNQYNQTSSANITGNASTITQSTIDSYLNVNADSQTWDITEVQGTVYTYPVANQNFTSDASGWVYGEASDENNWASGAWSSTGGNYNPGSYDLKVVDSSANILDSQIDRWINYSFSVSSIPQSAKVYACYETITSGKGESTTSSIRLIHPNGTEFVLYTGPAVTSSQTSFDCQTINANNYFDATGTYTLKLFTTGNTGDAAADKPTIDTYWDDAGAQLAYPGYQASVEHNATVSYLGTLYNINVSVNFTSTVDDTYQLYIYNFTNSGWDSSPCQSQAVTANQYYTKWCNVTDSPTKYISSDNKVRIRINSTGDNDQGTLKEEYVQYYVNYEDLPPKWSNNVTNFTSPVFYHSPAGYQFNVTWVDDASISKVLIEHNFTGGEPQNYTVTTFSGNVYYYDYGTIPPGRYVWREFANDSSNNWNVTNSGNYWSFVVYNATLEVNLTNPSPLTCTESYPCSEQQNIDFAMNATVKCKTDPAGQSCGYVNGSVRYNDTTTTMALIKNINYRKPITINNSLNTNTLTNYQVNITVDTSSLISNGKMRSDCGDMRFTDSDGATNLNYWIESGCNSGTTLIWVNVSSIPASSTKTIYMYYGNLSAISESNATNTMLGFENFDSVTCGSWSSCFIGTTYCKSCSNGWSAKAEQIWSTGTPNTNAVANQDSSDGNPSPSFNYTTDTSFFGDLWIYKNYTFGEAMNITVSFDRKAGGSYEAGYQHRWDVLNGSGVPCDKGRQIGSCGSGELNSSNTLYHEEHGNLASWTNKYKDNLTTVSGNITIAVWTQDGWTGQSFWSKIDNVKIRKYTSPEPTTNIGEEEIIYSVPFSTHSNTQSCGTLSDGGSCQLNWTVNASGPINSVWKIDSNFTSSLSAVQENYTEDAYVRITGAEDTTPPTYSLNSTNSTQANSAVLFSLRWDDDTALSPKGQYQAWLDNCTGYFVNVTPLTNFTSTPEWANFTAVINSTGSCIIRWFENATDNAGIVNDTGSSNPFSYYTTIPPQYSANYTSVLSGSQYSSGRNYGFQINFTDDDGVSKVLFEANLNESLKNYTVGLYAGSATDGLYVINFTDLAAGSYQYRWLANDTSNLWNTTGVISYTIAQNTSSTVYLWLNQTRGNYNYNTSNWANITAEAVNLEGKTIEIWTNYSDGQWKKWDSGSSPKQNLTQFTSAGVWNFTANFTNQNYTSSYESWYANVSLVNQPPNIFNLKVRDTNNETIGETNPSVTIRITVNVTDADNNLDYVQANFTWPNGTIVLQNMSYLPCGNWTHIWNYSLPISVPASPPNATINVTAYDTQQAANTTNTSIIINEYAELSLTNTPINFTEVIPAQIVNATESQGWPLNISVNGNVPLNLTQRGEDLVGLVNPSIKILVSNITWNQTISGIFSALSTAWQTVANNTQPGSFNTSYYKLYVPTISPQPYGGNITIQGSKA
jgi:hypothetical protein